jgi:hypothetical protein
MEHYTIGAKENTLALFLLCPLYKDGKLSTRWWASLEALEPTDDIVIPLGEQNVIFNPAKPIPKTGRLVFEPIEFNYSDSNLAAFLIAGQDGL